MTAPRRPSRPKIRASAVVEPVGEDEVKVLIDALNHYGSSHESAQTRFMMSLFTMFSLAVMGIATILLGTIYPKFNIFKELSGSSSTDSNAAMVALIFGVVAGSMLFFTLMMQIFRSLKNISMYNSIITTLVRRASQILDRGKFSFSQRMFLELKIAESEAIIRDGLTLSIVSKALGLGGSSMGRISPSTYRRS